ncbi:hypothetical protein MRX96_010788 [Rhipicephalus microplus]
MRSTVLAGFIALVICNVTHSEATSLEGHGAAAGMPLSFHNGGGSAMMNSFPGMDGDISGAGQPPSSSHFFG